MDEQMLQQAFEALFQALETSEAQSAAVLEFLKGKGIASDKEFAPYFDQASRASSVRWVAARARINRLLAAAMKPADKPESEKQEQGKPEKSERTGAQNSSRPEDEKKADTPKEMNTADEGNNTHEKKNDNTRATSASAPDGNTKSNPVEEKHKQSEDAEAKPAAEADSKVASQPAKNDEPLKSKDQPQDKVA
jgi:hypothetical protein